MRRLALTAFAAVLLVPATPANAAGPLTGPGCGIITPYGHVTTSSHVGVVWAGPLVNPFGDGELACSVQVGGTGLHSDDNDGFYGTFVGTVATLGPALFTFSSWRQETAYSCTRFTTPTGIDYYWSGSVWSRSAAVPCQQMVHGHMLTSLVTADVLELICDAVDCAVLRDATDFYVAVPQVTS